MNDRAAVTIPLYPLAKKIALVILIIIFASCHKLHNGNVVQKDYHEPFMSLMPMTIPSGKSITTIMIPIYYPESWSINVKGVVNNETRIEIYYINNEEYRTLKIGDFVCVDGKCSDRPYVEK